jgi:hypothetical protein
MPVKDVMLEQLAISRRIVTDGHENVPAWRIETPDGAWLILTRFDPDKAGQFDWEVRGRGVARRQCGLEAELDQKVAITGE